MVRDSYAYNFLLTFWLVTAIQSKTTVPEVRFFRLVYWSVILWYLDIPMMLNLAKFEINGRCGYVILFYCGIIYVLPASWICSNLLKCCFTLEFKISNKGINCSTDQGSYHIEISQLMCSANHWMVNGGGTDCYWVKARVEF